MKEEQCTFHQVSTLTGCWLVLMRAKPLIWEKCIIFDTLPHPFTTLFTFDSSCELLTLRERVSNSLINTLVKFSVKFRQEFIILYIASGYSCFFLTHLYSVMKAGVTDFYWIIHVSWILPFMLSLWCIILHTHDWVNCKCLNKHQLGAWHLFHF